MKNPILLLGISLLTTTACGGGGGSSDGGGSSGMFTSKKVLKACHAEVKSNIKAIKTAQMIHDAENDQFVSAAQSPSMIPGQKAVDWQGNSGFNTINWMPDGKVRGAYSVTTTWTNRMSDFKIIAKMDCDGDGVVATYTATKSLNAKPITPKGVH